MASTSSNSERSLAELFSSAKAKQERLDSGQLDTQTPASRAEVTRGAIDELSQCLRLVEQGSLFSANEEVEDIATKDLPYLAVPFLLAELLVRSYDSQHDRAAVLRRAADLLDAFLARLDHYRLLGKTEQELFERFQEYGRQPEQQQQQQHFSLTSPAAGPEEKRRIKISRFQEERALKQKLQHLRTQSRIQNVDDEVIRSLYLAEIALDVHQSFQSLDMISQELSILAQMQSAAPARATTGSGAVQDARRRQPSDGYSDRLDGPGTLAGLGRPGGPLLDKKGKPLQPFTIVGGRRSEMQKGVFRPGHNLPTMSIDEYLEEERRRGGIIEGGGGNDGVPVEPDEDNIELVDAATMKAREWDEFVEANPKGAGNTLNRG